MNTIALTTGWIMSRDKVCQGPFQPGRYMNGMAIQLKKEPTMFTITDKALMRHQCYINGQWKDALSGAAIPVTNPADGSDLGSVPDLSREEISAAIDAADAAPVDLVSL